MPSGAKKRKAARKKKENQPSDHPNASSASSPSHGGDEAKHQYDKESDVGEVSPHNSQHNLLTEGEEDEIEKRDNVTDLPSVEGEVSKVTAIPVKREFKIEDEPDGKNGRFEHDEAARKSYDGGSSRSSSNRSSNSNSSSDDESHGIESNLAVEEVAPVVDSVKVADSFSKVHVEAIESTHVEAASDLTVENVPPVVSEKISEKAELDVRSAADSCAASYVVESVSEENGDNKQSSVGAASEKGEAIDPSDEKIVQETDDPLSLSFDGHISTADNGRNANKDSGVTEPLLVPAHPVQTTSWRSCCGLFELFTGSGR